MTTLNIELTRLQAEFVDQLVRSGRYQDASDVLRDALRLLERREVMEAAELDALLGAADEAKAAPEDDFYD